MEATTFFFTGFPGFLGSETLPQILKLVTHAHAVLLVQTKFLAPANQKLNELTREFPSLKGRVSFVEGDLLQDNLGIAQSELVELQKQITQIFHFAAVYDLSVKRELAYSINVDGTKRMIDFARKCPELQRFHHVSTCYVSGRLDGVFKEGDLACGQKFNNYYEETKYFSEVEVQKARALGLPAVIYRPGIVVGNSRTGATQKYDGPYYVIRFILQQPTYSILPQLGDPTLTTLNVVPSDFIVESISKLSQHPQAVGQVFHLSDPQALTIDKVIEAIAKSTQHKIFTIPLPVQVTKLAVAAPGLKQLFKIPAATLDYFTHPTRYDSSATASFLKELNISVPHFGDYLPALVAFVRKHPELRSSAMI